MQDLARRGIVVCMDAKEFGSGLREALERHGVRLDVPRAAVPTADLLLRAALAEVEAGSSAALAPRVSAV
jgi:hypothetical protein